MVKFGKSLKSGTFGNLKNIFDRGKMKTEKFLCWNLGKVEKSGKKCEKQKNLVKV